MTLYVWLRFLHIFGVATFLFAHGVSGGAAFALRGPVSAHTRTLLRLSERSSFIANAGLILLLATGVWMTFAGSWSGRVWPWAAVVVLLAVAAFMGFIANPYRYARGAAAGPDDALAEHLRRTRPMLALWVGAIGLVVLLVLMIFKPL
ncbi:MAG: hypothetical protein E6I67_06940 [Chloroflexi bacterium]|nr:MAG: hypothetical protein E6I67_06940 [Chloroflexota bacterium]